MMTNDTTNTKTKHQRYNEKSEGSGQKKVNSIMKRTKKDYKNSLCLIKGIM